MSLDQPSPTAVTSEPRQDAALEETDALIKRLNTVVLCLSRDSRPALDDTTIKAIHSEVDHIELLLRDETRDADLDNEDEPDQNDSQPSQNVEDDDLKIRLAASHESQIPTEPATDASSPARRPPSVMTAQRALEITSAAEQLTSQLTASIKELQKRRGESEHIHGLLITRAEKAAERIVYLESELSEMDDDLEASQSELRFLRIQLQGIEAQCSQYMPQEEDEELSQSITNWRDDWEDIDRRSKARRMKRSVLLANVHSSREQRG